MQSSSSRWVIVTAIFRYSDGLAYLRTTGTIASGSMRRRSSCRFRLCPDRLEQRPVDIGPVSGEVEIRAFHAGELRPVVADIGHLVPLITRGWPSDVSTQNLIGGTNGNHTHDTSWSGNNFKSFNSPD